VWIDTRVRIEKLPFTVRPVRTEAELATVAALRSERYGDKIPQLRQALSAPESWDGRDGALVLGVWDRADGVLLGSMRLHDGAAGPLPVEGDVTLPQRAAGLHVAEATRLVVRRGHSLVKVALFKAIYLWAIAIGVDVIVVAGRDGIWQSYAALLFEDVDPLLGEVRLGHVADVPHRILGLSLADAYERWSAASQPLLDFICHTEHPDIDVTCSAP
jgi:hypothetical protein